MILLVAVFSLHHHTTHHCVGFFFTSLCGVFVFRLAFRAFSSFSSSVVPPLTQLHPSSLTQRAQLISHNSSPLTTYITHLTQLISHNSTHRTHLTQELLSCSIWWSCFRVAGSALAAAGVAVVWQAREFDFLQAAARGAPGAASACYGACRRALGLNSFHTTQLFQFISHN